MDEQHTPPATPQTASSALGWNDLGLILLLLLLAIGLRTWQLQHTEVAARDSIGYIRIAWNLEHGPNWRTVVHDSAQHPGYPATLLLVSLPVRSLDRDDLPMAMQRSAQLTSIIAAVLLVVPMFILGRELFDRRIGFWAALLFQCLPTSGRLMADGLSEPLFLLFACTALLLAQYGLRKSSPLWFAAAGLCSGLAYLTRPEGAFLIAATGLVLVGLQAFKAWRRPWLRCVECGVCLTLGALCVAGPFMLIIGGLTTKHTANEVVKLDTPPPASTVSHGEEQEEPTDPAEAPEGSVTGTLQPLGRIAGLRLFLFTMVKSFYYVTWIPALLGFVLFRDRFRRVPIAWVMLLVSLALGYFLYRVPVVMGYLSDRHTVLILFCGVFWTAATLLRVGDWCAARFAQRRPLWATALLLPLVAAGLVKTLEPLHTDRLAFREAGHWLKQNALPGDAIDDPYSWASYYAGRPFVDRGVELPKHVPPLSYVVVEQTGDEIKQPRIANHVNYNGLRGRDPLKTWPVQRGNGSSCVAIYEIRQ